ncbi:hypothetical protein Glove_132g228 [Diversispora epigaea]|uniref:Uncharacterized protein n=1 Tax=Diversispora epigaea TaxID=1348612 RepID=A0A397IXP3_9GLOM|nr:hypothetical protein Glove_132g228 [Diversispora epigaea]
MLLSITLTALSAVTASIIIPIFKYLELKEQRKHKNETAQQHSDESNNESNYEEANIESSDPKSNELANTSVDTLGVYKCENESRNDGGAEATSKTAMLPPLLKLSISSDITEEERFNNLNNKIDEILTRVETMRKHREQKHQTNHQQ